ncbi:glutathionylspermidine synthase family protein [Flectobacillus roseus]|uniref:Glutathionylspermidine synthase family protein n=1 Tax=Flectobacillus roseus TaxID=502259 RepID=A0ABT6YFZ5_9BACT|nr:glutathionylspermidine synthase family protein [Flectobacillus roseus]MDI9862485.1 glutathionylspermidine synthase family protein [Flectobacillus roseus]MDI9872287.1 glutathionylspermidine synthase family protein [Flectobacillus roseus]
MIHLKSLSNSPEPALRNADWYWMLGEDTQSYLTNQVVVVSEAEAEKYYAAANELYEMYIEAAQHVIDQHKFAELGIPENLIELVKYSWENDRHWHIYGRFDLAGGLNGKPIKLIEFNADTATCIPETAVVQWASLKANRLDETLQFNTLYESLVAQFSEMRKQNPKHEPTLLISTMEGYPEDDTNMQVLGEAAREAGFEVAFEYIENTEFSSEEGIYKQSSNDGSFTRYDFWFKLVPWEYIGWDEPELTQILTDLVTNDKTIVLNPAYTLLFQSKGILKVLWQLFPNHPLLLETASTPLVNKTSVEKVLFGREGANVKILDTAGNAVSETEGEYFEQNKVYQEYVDFLQDSEGSYYQAGVFFAGEACGLGFRKGGKIINNTAQFVGHIIE